VTDYEVEAVVPAATGGEVKDLLRDARRAVRVVGTQSRQARLPPPPRPVTLLCTRGLGRIQRLEADDLTCSVEPGVLRADLDAALAERRLCLPCGGDGSLGGLFAAGERGPLAPGAASPRSLLIGFEGVLADGEAFKAGARVVKSVAGFDLNKPFVGSRGRLFVVTLLHLKLRPLPPASVAFRREGLPAADAVALWQRLRQLPSPPIVLLLGRLAGAFTVSGTFTGTERPIDATLRELGLPRGEAQAPGLADSKDREVLRGTTLPSRIQSVLDELPGDAPFVADGCGQFEVALHEPQTDALLARLPALGAAGEIVGGRPARRGTSTPGDPGALRLARALKLLLDPEERLL
jgi:FAD/FMN-containing dehydrogenase